MAMTLSTRAWQVVGAKYVRLYAPAEAARLYPHGAGMHTNTSRVQPEDILATEVRTTPSWIRSRANFSLFFFSCIPACMHGPTCIFWASLTPFSLEAVGGYGGGRFPALAEAAFVEAVLEPGDVLYIPNKWWHFVKSLSTSISIAFHFS
jgi:lysine-specific demethylase 8